jgi:TolA-binding protein
VRVATATLSLLLVGGCLSEPPAAAGADESTSTMASTMASAYRRGDCAEVLRLAPAFSAASDVQLRVVTVWVGTCLRRVGEYVQSVEALTPVATATPPVLPTPRALLETGRAWSGATAFSEAHDAFDRLITGFPRHSLVDDANYYDGSALRRLRRYDEAVARFDAAEQSPRSTAFRRGGARYYRGVTNVARGRFDLAAADFGAAVDGSGDTPFAAKAAVALARLPFDEGDCSRGEASLVSLAQATVSTELSAAASLERARGVRGCGDDARAEALLVELQVQFATTASADDARFEWALIEFARARDADRIDDPTDKALYASARGRFEGFLVDYPLSRLGVAAHLHIGRSWVETRAYELALTEFQAVAAAVGSTYVDNAVYYSGLTRYLRRGAGDLDAALASFARVLELPGPSSYADDATYYRGRALDLLGRKAEARAAFEGLLARFASSPLRDNALFYVAALSVAAGDCAAALAAVGELRDAFPASTYVAQAELIVASCTTP